ncbi:hypothetical protein [Alkaliphilus serpentinus]|uniref:Uncharacterized protein n=1 Tax=Alkaliphilus serpentinus TaxID=1482731 RepID=A0A833M7W8_9FIRM|nr:hypothetical protein [Alkaliphilus serpentinus]KAB3529417.1 hypothetical protein F8153_09295 [Alkaliphilus serpentinus]
MRKNKFLLVIGMAVALILIYFWNPIHSPWESVTYPLTEKAEEYVIFQDSLKRGTEITCRLDLKSGAEDKGKLTLVLPNGEEIQWTEGYQQTGRQLKMKASQSGEYLLILSTSPIDNTQGISPPEVEVDWFF